MVLGVLALVSPFITGVALTIALGAVLVVGALLHVASAFAASSLGGILWQVLLGILYAIAGISLLANPVLGLTTVSLLVIGFLVASGVLQLVWAVVGGTGTRLWLAIAGVVSLALGAMLWLEFPTSAAWLVGVLFGVNLLVTGGSMIVQGQADGGTAPSRERTGASQRG